MGRPKGALNKTTLAAKEIIAAVADRLGGADGLYQWANKSPRNKEIFWSSIYPRLIPVQTEAPDSRSFNFHFTTATKDG
jgi:hypothetical protein